jgi:hypothetical protein
MLVKEKGLHELQKKLVIYIITVFMLQSSLSDEDIRTTNQKHPLLSETEYSSQCTWIEANFDALWNIFILYYLLQATGCCFLAQSPAFFSYL